LELLEDVINPTLTDIIENDKHYLEDQLVFQQNGALPHYARLIQNIQIKLFQVIGLEGEALLNDLLGDLSSLDFFL